MKKLKIQSRKIIYFVEDNIKNGYVIYGEAGVVKYLGISRRDAIKSYMKYAGRWKQS